MAAFYTAAFGWQPQSLRAIEQAGGTVAGAPQEIPGVGLISRCLSLAGRPPRLDRTR